MSSTTELLHEAEFRKCRDDPEYFFEHFCFVRHPSAVGILPFVIRDAQRDTMTQMLENDRVIILKARQIGFSTLMSNFALWLVFFHPYVEIIFISRTEAIAEDLLGKARFSYDLLPLWMQARGPKPTSRNMQAMPYDNSSGVISVASRSNPARGKTASWVFCDEFAFLENQEEAWASIEPTADIGGKIVILSTANGMGNLFQEMWYGAKTGTNGFVPVFHSWAAVPERDQEWLKKKMDQLAEWQRAQEYPRTEDEAFIKSGNPVFDVDKLARWLPEAPIAQGQLVVGPDDRRLENTGHGPLEVWDTPQPGKAYVIGVDTAEGLAHGDFCSAHVMDVASAKIVAHWHGHIDPDSFGTVLYELGMYYNLALLCVENNFHGGTVLNQLKRLRYRRLYYSVIFDTRKQTKTEKMGWSTTIKTKPLMIDELAGAIRDETIDVPSKETIAELTQYARDEKGRTNGQPHDDRVISLALCVQMLKFAFLPSHDDPQVGMQPFTEAWYCKDMPKPGDNDWVLGGANVR